MVPHIVIALVVLALTVAGCALFMHQRAFSDGGLIESGEGNGEDIDKDGIPSDLFWPKWRLPIRVIISPNIDQSYIDHIVYSVGIVNSIVPIFDTKFATGPETMANYIEIGGAQPPSGTCYVYTDDGDDPNRGVTETRRHVNGEVVSCSIKLPINILENHSTARNVTLHEFLHAAGLAHDSDPRSIMFPQSNDERKVIQETDIELLRKVYREKP